MTTGTVTSTLTAGKTESPVPTLLRAAGAVAALAWAVLAAIQMANPTFDDQLTTTVDYLNDATFTAALAATAVAADALLRIGAPPAWAVRMVQFGYLLVAAGVSVGLILGHSPSWFAAVGVPGNLVAIIGLVAAGIHGLRRRSLPRPVAALAIPTGLFTVLFSEFGSSLLACVFWLIVVLRSDRGAA